MLLFGMLTVQNIIFRYILNALQELARIDMHHEFSSTVAPDTITAFNYRDHNRGYRLRLLLMKLTFAGY